jgi:hypothetical protein
MSKGSGKGVEVMVNVDPITLRFQHSRIRPFFTGCGRRVEDTLKDIQEGILKVEDLPLITVVRGGDGSLVSLNNRRLYVLKKLREEGRLANNEVKVRLKPALARELERYTKDRCSLNATVMREHKAGGGDVDGDGEVEGVGVGEGKLDTPTVSDAAGKETVFAVTKRGKDKGKDKEKVKCKGKGKGENGGEEEGDAGGADDYGAKKNSNKKDKEATKMAPLPPKVTKAWKGMQKDVSKGQSKKVHAWVDDLEEEGSITADQLTFILAELGIQD